MDRSNFSETCTLFSSLLSLYWVFVCGPNNQSHFSPYMGPPQVYNQSVQPYQSTVTWEFNAALTVCLSPAGVFAPTLFSKAYGNFVCDSCSNSTGNSTSNSSGPFICHNCHYDLVGLKIQLQHYQNYHTENNLIMCNTYLYFFLSTAKFHIIP